jgi:Spy/CpxP family protein refolding chaperone
MNAKTINLKVATLAILMVSLTSIASAIPPYADISAKGNISAKGEVFSELNLTAQQQDKIKSQKEENKQKTDLLKEQMRVKRLELKNEIVNANADTNKIKSLSNDIKNILGQLVDLRVDGILFLKQTLTPEQFAKFQEIAQGQKEKIGQKFNGLKEKRKNKNKPNNAPLDNQEGEELNEGL